MNVWSNVDKIKDVRSFLGYFGSGAIGGAVSVTNPALGGTLTAGLNVGVDVATGNLPNFNNPMEAAKYGLFKFVEGFGTAGVGSMTKAGINAIRSIGSGAGWFRSFAVSGQMVPAVGGGYLLPEATLTVTRIPANQMAANAARIAAKTGVQYSDDLLKAAQQAYPKLAGKTQLHHISPKYLGGPANGPLIKLDAAYHQQITNAFRQAWPYGNGVIKDPVLRQQILDRVYSQFPLPK